MLNAALLEQTGGRFISSNLLTQVASPRAAGMLAPVISSTSLIRLSRLAHCVRQVVASKLQFERRNTEKQDQALARSSNDAFTTLRSEACLLCNATFGFAGLRAVFLDTLPRTRTSKRGGRRPRSRPRVALFKDSPRRPHPNMATLADVRVAFRALDARSKFFFSACTTIVVCTVLHLLPLPLLSRRLIPVHTLSYR